MSKIGNLIESLDTRIGAFKRAPDSPHNRAVGKALEIIRSEIESALKDSHEDSTPPAERGR